MSSVRCHDGLGSHRTSRLIRSGWLAAASSAMNAVSSPASSVAENAFAVSITTRRSSTRSSRTGEVPGRDDPAPHAAAIGDDEAGERREPLQEPHVLGDEPVRHHVRCFEQQVDQVVAPGPRHLIGEGEVAVLRVEGARDRSHPRVTDPRPPPSIAAILGASFSRRKRGAGSSESPEDHGDHRRSEPDQLPAAYRLLQEDSRQHHRHDRNRPPRMLIRISDTRRGA